MPRLSYLNSTFLLLNKFFFLVSFNLFILPKEGLLFQFIITMTVSLLVTFLSFQFFKCRDKTIIFSFFMVGLFLCYGLFKNILREVFPNEAIILIIYFLFSFGVLYQVLRWSQSKKLHCLMSIASNTNFFMVVFSLFFFNSYFKLQKGAKSPKIEQIKYSANPETHVKNKAKHPDVYYFVLDGYCREDVLKTSYAYDNTPFLSQLKELGFTISDKATSSYPLTYASLPSTLNMQYIKDATGQGKKYYDFIKDNQVGRYFQSSGYKYITVNTGWPGTQISHIADIQYKLPFSDSFLSMFLDNTLLSPWLPKHEDCVVHTIKSVKEAVALDGPKFLFAHFLLPHSPYSFKANGELTHCNDKLLTAQLYTKVDKTPEGLKAYTEQLQYCNREVLKVIDHILANSETKPIIVIQSDHGWETTLKRDYLDKKYCKERYSVLNAMLVPEELRAEIKPSFSTVNTFRVLFNHIFDESLPILDKKMFGVLDRCKNDAFSSYIELSHTDL